MMDSCRPGIAGTEKQVTSASLHRSGRIGSGSVDAQHGDALTFRDYY